MEFKMNIKNIFSNLIKYTPENDYSFSLLEKPYEQDENKEDNFSEDKTKIFSSVNVNLDYVKSKYNTLINSDIVLREFTLNARGKQFHAFILYFDGMINTQMLNDFVLEPLMMRNKNNLFDGDQNKVIYESVTNNVTIRKVKKFNLSDYLKNCLIPQNDLKEVKTFSECFSGINSGNCALFVDTLPIAFNIEIKGFQQRSVEKPTNEIVIKGSHEAFVENIRTNTSLLRRIINNENLTIENIPIGKVSKTKCCLCYIKNIANTDLIGEVRYRLNNLGVDALLSAGQLEELISDENDLSVPDILSTERPDKASAYLLEGRVVIIVNGSPYALITPAVFVDFLKSLDDRNLKANYSNFIKSIRFIAALLHYYYLGYM